MMQLETVPRVLPDSHFETMDEARAEADKRRLSPSAKDAVTQISDSPYGGYLVQSFSAEALVRALADPVHPLAAEFLRQSREAVYD